MKLKLRKEQKIKTKKEVPFTRTARITEFNLDSTNHAVIGSTDISSQYLENRLSLN